MTPHHRGMMDDSHWNVFTSDFGDYELGPAIGFGASSTVYEAIFTIPSSIYPISTNSTITTTPPTASDERPKNGRPSLSISLPDNRVEVDERICAIKVSTSHPDVELLAKEIKLLGLCRHPNVLRILSTFTLPPDHHRICLVTPFIPGGSLSGILSWRSRLITSPKTHHFPSFRIGHRKHKNDDDGEGEEQNGRLDEEEIKCVTRQVLEGLEYLHTNGFLHRDVKAGNLLIDEDGTILLADFGVGGDLNAPPSPVRSRKTRLAADELRFDENETPKIQQNGFEDLKKRKSFVGTPNWMAPEVILGQKYDQKADIWSLGITLLELAHGSVPGWKYKPNKALSHIITDPSPTLDRSVGGYSKLMKEFIDLSLNKDPVARPTAKALMDHHWLKGAKKNTFLAHSLLADVPPLAQRQELRRVPTKSSLLSHASSWDFSNTPNPSIPSSPIRNSLLIPSARSPSISSHMEYFNSVGRSHSHSRTSSFSGLPPSPRVSLRQWAEKNYEETGAGSNQNQNLSLSLSFRTGSERGSKRKSLSSAGLLRKGKSTSFDFPNQGKSPMDAISPSLDVKIQQPRDPILDEQSQTQIGVMSPVMEITKSQDGGCVPELEGLGISNARLQNGLDLGMRQGEGGLSESPENVLELRRPDERAGEGSDDQMTSGQVQSAQEGYEEKSGIQGKEVNVVQQDRDSPCTTTPSVSEPPQPPTRSPTIIETPINQSNGNSPNTKASSHLDQSVPVKSVEKEKEKKHWLSKGMGMKRNESSKPFLTRISSKNEAQEHSVKEGGHAMGKSGSWQGVLGRVAGKMHWSDKR
uniref:STE/STE20/FRAY protein kinase n=1 Tax=Kwoniella bestiolae CBS 10118 TaxID=1296100 RepID=A0A1B9GGF8_9TREE|nr:STE/STE20/FRAY protein kinase [Kwoniella bestiolae CBS 10118]OCF30116.1 STE/STE20/FRAY protein kinase [Kwoniella bestiolae CBS 10118]